MQKGFHYKLIISILIVLFLLNCLITTVYSAELTWKGREIDGVKTRYTYNIDNNSLSGTITYKDGRTQTINYNLSEDKTTYTLENAEDASNYLEPTISAESVRELSRTGNNVISVEPGESEEGNTDTGENETTEGGGFHDEEGSNNTKGDYGLGGVLFNPIVDLLVRLGDAVMNSLQIAMLGNEALNDNVNILGLQNYTVRSDNKKLQEYLAQNEEFLKGDVTSNTTVNVDRFKLGWLSHRKTFSYPMARYSPQEIFSGNVKTLNVNFFRQSTGNTEREKLTSAIANWYIGLRNLSAVGLLLILVYTGIRMIISSTAASKSKYKNMMLNWLVALLLLFSMHYIMSLTLTVIDTICDGINETGNTYISIALTSEENRVPAGGETFKTNLIGAARIQTQYKNVGMKVNYVIMYVALVIYTVVFTLYYLKRFFMMAFLTMIAPLVVLTYPLDKMGDGKAQAFSAWLKEYVYNALLQPFHLIIYTVFVSNALDFARTNVIYMIGALWLVMESEKILRKFFGFNKARSGTIGALKTIGFASMIGNMANAGQKFIGGAKNETSNKNGEKPVRFHEKPDLSRLNAPEGDENKKMQNADEEKNGMRNFDSQGYDENANQLNSNDTGKQYSDSEYRQTAVNPEYNNKEFTETMGKSKEHDKPETSNKPKDVNDSDKKGTGFSQKLKNLWNANTYGLGRKAKRTLKGVAKVGTRTVFRASTGSLAAAIAVASGGDMGAALAAYSAGAGVGERLGNKATNVVGKVPNAINKQIDIANGNNDRQNAAELKAKMNDENNLNYIRDKLVKEKGVIPSSRRVREEMENYKPYLAKGLNMQESTKAMNAAKEMGIKKSEDAALMAAFIKERGITKSVLDKKEDREHAENNIRSQLRNKNDSMADLKTQYVMDFASKYHGSAKQNKKA